MKKKYHGCGCPPLLLYSTCRTEERSRVWCLPISAISRISMMLIFKHHNAYQFWGLQWWCLFFINIFSWKKFTFWIKKSIWRLVGGWVGGDLHFFTDTNLINITETTFDCSEKAGPKWLLFMVRNSICWKNGPKLLFSWSEMAYVKNNGPKLHKIKVPWSEIT